VPTFITVKLQPGAAIWQLLRSLLRRFISLQSASKSSTAFLKPASASHQLQTRCAAILKRFCGAVQRFSFRTDSAIFAIITEGHLVSSHFVNCPRIVNDGNFLGVLPINCDIGKHVSNGRDWRWF